MKTEGRKSIVQSIENCGLVAVIRADGGEVGPSVLVDLCKALRDGGVKVAEITMTSPGALQAITEARSQLDGQCIIGVGSVLDRATAEAAISAGAQFVVAPTFNPEVVSVAHEYDCPVMPGALTPNEIQAAWEAGADMVKVFPAHRFGPGYLKDVLAPLPHLKLMPTGGVNLDNAREWIKAGAVALGVGSTLVRKDLIAKSDFSGLTRLAEQFVDVVRQARAQG